MKKLKQSGKIIIPAGRRPWPHELRVADILATAGHRVEFLTETNNLPTADIKLDGMEYEIKSPEKMNANSLEHLIKNALRQSPNIIIDASRMRKVRDDSLCKFLVRQVSSRKQIKSLLLITKQGKIVLVLKKIVDTLRSKIELLQTNYTKECLCRVLAHLRSIPLFYQIIVLCGR